MDTSRRNFIGGLTAVMALPPTIGICGDAQSEDWFQDIRVDRYYDLKGGPYKDTGGWGCPGYSMACELIERFQHYDRCRELEDKAAAIEKKGFYLTPSQYFGAPWRQYDKIPMTKKWVMEFYRRHKAETWEDWKARYDEYFMDYKDGKYSPKKVY